MLAPASTRSRMRMMFNGQNLVSTSYSLQSPSGAVTANVGADWYSLDCSSGEGFNRAANDVIKHYQEYKYNSASIEWLPSVGPSSTEAAGRIFIAYIDNPELIVAFKAASDATRGTMVKQVANVKNFNIWERFLFRVPLTYRRKIFNVDPTIATPSNEETDRAIQGLVIVTYNTIGGTATSGALGTWKLMSNTLLKGFTATIVT